VFSFYQLFIYHCTLFLFFQNSLWKFCSSSQIVFPLFLRWENVGWTTMKQRNQSQLCDTPVGVFFPRAKPRLFLLFLYLNDKKVGWRNLSADFEHCCQFYQHFTSSFFAHSIRSIQFGFVIFFVKWLLSQKPLIKMLLKLTTDVYFTKNLQAFFYPKEFCTDFPMWMSNLEVSNNKTQNKVCTLAVYYLI